MSVVGTEFEALRAVEQRGEEAVAQSVAKLLRMNVDYVRTILNGLARRDYLILSAKGIYYMTAKGRQEIERRMG